MAYALDKPLTKKLTKLIPEVDKDVIRILVEIAPSSSGDDWLYFRVVLKDDPGRNRISDAFGKRLMKISTALRNRAANLNVPMFASVDFVSESELPPLKRKIA
ncbi:MAG TPA: hypothetical protein VH165_24710 [Kofleriaceae bacterium]|nr:hypothetical protein [Kofleriaceae bacterium]